MQAQIKRFCSDVRRLKCKWRCRVQADERGSKEGNLTYTWPPQAQFVSCCCLSADVRFQEEIQYVCFSLCLDWNRPPYRNFLALFILDAIGIGNSTANRCHHKLAMCRSLCIHFKLLPNTPLAKAVVVQATEDGWTIFI